MRPVEKRPGKKQVLALIIAVVILASFAVAVETGLILYLAPYPYEEPIPNPGHGADEAWIDTTPGIPGGEMTVQDAVAAGFISQDTKCDSAGSCPQVCIGAVCRNSWPAGPTGITQISQGSGITLSPNPITGTGTIGSNYSQVQQRISGTCPEGQSIRVINQNGTVSCEVDTTCAILAPFPGTCSQVCIGSDCRRDWIYETTYCRARLSGSCSCDGGDELLGRVSNTPCWASSSSGGCGAAGGFSGSCCVCGR